MGSRFRFGVRREGALALIFTLVSLCDLKAGPFDLHIRDQRIVLPSQRVYLNQKTLLGWICRVGVERPQVHSTESKPLISYANRGFLPALGESNVNREANLEIQCLKSVVSQEVSSDVQRKFEIDDCYPSVEQATIQGKALERHPSRFVGYTMLGSGLFLSSWGIVSWEIREYQECPPRNTDNVIKIVAGILLINAALFYIYGGCD